MEAPVDYGVRRCEPNLGDGTTNTVRVSLM
jgi:hypothetical protein